MRSIPSDMQFTDLAIVDLWMDKNCDDLAQIKDLAMSMDDLTETVITHVPCGNVNEPCCLQQDAFAGLGGCFAGLSCILSTTCVSICRP